MFMTNTTRRIKFPQIPKMQRLNYKIFPEQEKEMKELRKYGHTLKYIAMIFHCSECTVLRHVDNNYRKRSNAISYRNQVRYQIEHPEKAREIHQRVYARHKAMHDEKLKEYTRDKYKRSKAKIDSLIKSKRAS